MLKKLLFSSVLFISLPCFAELDKENLINATASSDVTISAAGAGKVNCLSALDTSISVYGANTATFRVIDGLGGGATIYSVVVSTTGGLSSPNPISAPISFNDPLCGSLNTAMQIRNSATTFSINYKPFVKRVAP